jgi:ATP-dependent RNA helicase DeaD
MSVEEPAVLTFRDLGLPNNVLQALDEIGYEIPTPIQARTIPPLLAGTDVLGQAQTGTGKTAAFALPLLARIDLALTTPQVLVLVPTRELAIQVAEAFQRYASRMPGLHILPIYGGQDYGRQLRQLERGVHVVVGTPGRVMDHMRRGTLNLDRLTCLVLDEADEMLRMGFIDDVEWVLEQLPAERQIALFSATMPPAIRKITQRHLRNPEEISIRMRTTTAENIRQRYWMVSHLHKLDVLTRILEVEPFEGLLIFVRTKNGTIELAERLEARGFASAALNGDIKQSQRERTVDQFKRGKLDILIATDVAARGLDVERISHVINYDIPNDTETYIHRVGRTGRAGRSGEAILFVSPRERRMLSAIEQATKQKIELMEFPSTKVINDLRIAQFKQRITDVLDAEGLEFWSNLIEQYQEEHNIPANEIAAALAKLVQGEKPLLLDKPVHTERPERPMHDAPRREEYRRDDDRGGGGGDRMERFRLDVGSEHGAIPKNIVGAIANEAGLDGKLIRGLEINGDHSFVDLPAPMPEEIFQILKKTRVCNRPLNISRAGAATSGGGSSFRPKRPFEGGGGAPFGDRKPRPSFAGKGRPSTGGPGGPPKKKFVKKSKPGK